MRSPVLQSQVLQSMARRIERLSIGVGHFVSWGTLIMVLVTAVVVLLRHVFSVGWIWLQEVSVYFHALVFLLGAAYTLTADEHVRVDLFYRKFSRKTQRWVETIGALLFLLPTMSFLFWSSWSYVIRSWIDQESSHETGGLIYPFPSLLKTSILVACVLLILQALSNLIRLWGEDTQGPDSDHVNDQQVNVGGMPGELSGTDATDASSGVSAGAITGATK